MLPALALSLALSWVQVQSDTFVVKSSVGEERAKHVLRELEAFHELIGTALVFRKVELPELPIEVLIVGDEALRTELESEYNGKKVKVAGYYQRGQDRDFIVLSGNSNGNMTRIAYHELTHYFLSRALQSRPIWLSEGLAEYFAASEIDGDTAYLGGLSEERLAILKTNRRLTLKELLAVDERSPYYNETDKANVFYSESWAFVHFLTHGSHRNEFRRYLAALAQNDVKFSDYVTTDLASLNSEFEVYLNAGIRTIIREKIKISPESWTMTVRPVSGPEVELAIVEIFLSAGRLADARRHLEKVAGLDDEFPRASYYRGVLARLTGEGNPRELFIDALMDPNLGPRAAVQLVQLHELSPPAVRTSLERAAASGTHMADVYWALSELYLDDARHIEEMVRLTQAAAGSPLPSVRRDPSVSEPSLNEYFHGNEDHFNYRLLSQSGAGPAVKTFVPPELPEELPGEHLNGTVEMDVQVMENGEVGGVWLISATPEVLSSLATAAIREWKFEAVPGKVRVVLQFVP